MNRRRKFLLLTSRAQENIAANEYAQYLRLTGLAEAEVERVRLEQMALPDYDLAQFNGVIICGSPYDTSKPAHLKDPVQQRVEADLDRVISFALDTGLPLLGVCYGVGTILGHLGARIDTTYGEEISAPAITLTEAGVADPITRGMPRVFHSYVGHKEAAATVPAGVEVLATGEKCPVQLFRVGANIYGTQFHPELDWPAIELRIIEYAQVGYYPLAEQERILTACAQADVTASHAILANFVALYS